MKNFNNSEIDLKRPSRSIVKIFGLLVISLFISFASQTNNVSAAGGAPKPIMVDWSFGGVFGHFDRGALRRGYQVYQEVCSACHGLKYIAFRNLTDPGGPEFSEDEAKEIATEATIIDGPDDEGEMYDRAGLLKDYFVSPFPNDNAARSANSGALPPDLSLMTKARGYERGFPYWIFDMFTGYQEHGADYVYSLLVGYKDEAPDGFEIADGMSYNEYFAGHQIAMSPPLFEDQVEYLDGTPATLENMSKDVVTFLMWTAEPKLEERKRMGIKVISFLIILSILLFFSTKKLWSREPH